MSPSLKKIQYNIFLIFVFLIPFEHILLVFMGVNTFFKPYRIFGILLIVFSFLIYTRTRKLIKVPTFDKVLLVLVFYSLVVSVIQFGFGNLHLGDFINDYTQLLFFILVYLAVKSIYWTEKRLHKTFQVFVLAVILNSISIFVEFYFIGELARPKGFVDNPNHAAWQMVICSSYLFNLIFFGKVRRAKLLFSLGLIIFFGAALMPTGARSALVLYLISPLLLYNIIKKYNRIKFIFFLAIGLIAAPIFLSLEQFNISGENKAASERTALDRLVEGADKKDPRGDLWKGGIKAGVDSYLLGIGIGQFRRRGKEFITNPENSTIKYYLAKESGLGVHSDYIAIFAKTGLVGIILYLTYLVGFLHSYVKSVFFKSRKMFFETLYFVILLIFILYGIFNEGFLIPTFWISLILISQSIKLNE